MTRWATLAIGFLAFCSCPVTSPAQAQSGEGWITLFDGKNLDHWQGDGNANFAIEEGVELLPQSPLRRADCALGLPVNEARVGVDLNMQTPRRNP